MIARNDNGRKSNRGKPKHPKLAPTTLLDGKMLHDFNTEDKQLPELILANGRFDFGDRQVTSSSNDNPPRLD